MSSTTRPSPGPFAATRPRVWFLLVLGGLVVQPAPSSEGGSRETSSGHLLAQSQDDQQGRDEEKKKRGKVVEATVVEPEEGKPEPEPDTAPESSPAGEPAPEPSPPAAADRSETAPPSDLEPVSEVVDVTEVLIDVLVTDRGGNVVRGLGKEDFIVEEEGEEQTLTGVTFYGGIEELQGSGSEENVRTDRYFILFFHDQSRNLPTLKRFLMDAGRSAREWVEEEMLPNDQVAVLGYDVKLEVYEDFTRDRERLIDAISTAAAGGKAPDRWKRYEDETPPMSDSPSLLLNLPTGKTLRRETAIFERTLELIGRASEGIVGRKNLVLFSIGFGQNVDFNEVWRPDVRYYTDMERSLNSGNVAVYAVDVLASRRGPSTGPGISSSLSAIATDTGGQFYQTFSNFILPLRNIAEDNRGYYLLSYRSEYPEGTTGYREVRVRTPHKGLQLRYRRGYQYGEPEERRSSR